MHDGLIFTPITLFIPFSLKIQELVKRKEYFLSAFISLIPVGIFYFSNASSYELHVAILIAFLTMIPLLFLTYIILYLLGFADFYLNSKNIDDNNIINPIFYLFYLTYMTLIYFTSNSVVRILYNFLFKIFY